MYKQKITAGFLCSSESLHGSINGKRDPGNFGIIKSDLQSVYRIIRSGTCFKIEFWFYQLIKFTNKHSLHYMESLCFDKHINRDFINIIFGIYIQEWPGKNYGEFENKLLIKAVMLLKLLTIAATILLLKTPVKIL